MIKKPLISVIVPVYNVETYIEQTLNSVTSQSVGFEANVELIIIDDGSTDTTEDKVLSFKTRYPDNVIYIKNSKNLGVSATRNKGLDLARGKYVHFMDGDDVIKTNFYERLSRFLQVNDRSIDFAAAKIKYFDAKIGEHYLNNKFTSTRIIDVNKNPELSVFHMPTTLIKRSALKGLKLDVKLKVTEDTKLLTEVLVKKKKYGVVHDTTYYYRTRGSAGSAVAGKLKNRSYFLDTPHRALQFIFDVWTDKEGNIHRYAQFLVMNDVSWKIMQEPSQSVLSHEEQEAYKQSIYSLVRKIDDDIIIGNTSLGLIHRVFLLVKKYGREEYEKRISYKHGKYFFDGHLLSVINNEDDNFALELDFITPEATGVYRIEGSFRSGFISSNDEARLKTSKGLFKLHPVERAQRRQGFLGDDFFENVAFEATIEASPEDVIEGTLSFAGERAVTIPLFTRQFTGLGILNNTYTIKKESILRKEGKIIRILPVTQRNRIVSEVKFLLRVLRNVQARNVLSWLRTSLRNIDVLADLSPRKKLIWDLLGPIGLLFRSAAFGVWDTIFRLLYFAGVYKAKRPIWLISDRGTAAGDNGEALYKYILSSEDPDADVYFVISKKSPDYRRLRRIGKVVDIDSFKYHMLFLRSSLVISSAADYYVYNAFGYRWTHFSDLYKFSFVFLQHGVTKDDLSSWLNKYEKNIKVFVTSAQAEYESVINGDYYYNEKEVLLSGLPRFDLLQNTPEGKLMLAPTWRHNLLPEKRHHKSGIRGYSADFRQTEYFKFYSGIMNDQRILNALQEAKMQGELYLHPAFSEQAKDFPENPLFTVKEMPYDYKHAFATSNVLVTDYSSVAFDFAYLRKPVVYTQFDKASLYDDHIYSKGYFSYERDGFGPVAESYEEAVDAIVTAILDPDRENVYLKRVNKFFKYDDKNNSRRVYDRIKSL